MYCKSSYKDHAIQSVDVFAFVGTLLTFCQKHFGTVLFVSVGATLTENLGSLCKFASYCGFISNESFFQMSFIKVREVL